MKDRIRALISDAQSQEANRWLVRQYLQHYVLYLLFRTKHYRRLVFTGGTALRILFELPRFSEDLDFSLAGPGAEFDFGVVRRDLTAELTRAGYHIADKPSEGRNVVNTFLKFPGLLHELDLSPHTDEVVSVKLEVDTTPPEGARTRIALVNRYHMMYQVLHHDLATLLAGKLHALCFRGYAKARDLYDIFWFLSSRPELEPNLAFLNSTTIQTEKSPVAFDAGNWRALVLERLERMDFQRARQEIRPFLEQPEQADLLTLDNLQGLLSK